MRYTLALIAVLCLAAPVSAGTRIAVLGDTVISTGAQEAPLDFGGSAGAFLLSDMISHTASGSQAVDSALLYGRSTNGGTIDCSVYEIDGADTTKKGTATVSPSTDIAWYGADFNPDITITSGMEYLFAFGDTTGTVVVWARTGVATSNCRTSSLLSDWTGGDNNLTFTYAVYGTVVNSGATSTDISGVSLSGVTIGN